MRAPERMCTVCRKRRPKAALLRLVRGADGRIALDSGAGLPGRGAYVCRVGKCANAEHLPKLLSRALKTSIDEEQVTELAAAIHVGLGQGLEVAMDR